MRSGKPNQSPRSPSLGVLAATGLAIESVREIRRPITDLHHSRSPFSL
jgi:hypothetical protein